MATDQPTEQRLLDVAIDHFGRFGLDGASTRAIARDADTLMSSITYHYGGKQGLYLAAADHIAATMTRFVAPALAQVSLFEGDFTPENAKRALQIIVAHVIGVMVGQETAAIARFIVREQADPTEAFDRIYAGVMSHMLARIAGLLRIISRNRLDEHAAKLRAMTIVGQVLIFRVARATVLRGAEWTEIGEDELKEIQAHVAENLEAIVDSLERKGTT
jgi:AcrR family transcriptional regulator